MDVWINELFMNLLLGILKILDSIMNIFRQLVGIDTVRVIDGSIEQDMTLTEYFLSNSIVSNVFWAIFIISLSICAVCIIVAVVKSIIVSKNGEHKAHSKTVMQGVASVIITIFMAGLMIGGISMANTILAKIDLAFKVNNNLPIPATILDISVENGYEQDMTVMERIKYYQIHEWDKVSDFKCEITDDNGNVIATYTQPIWDEENNDWIYSVYVKAGSGYLDGKSVNDFLNPNGTFRLDLSAKDLYGQFKKTLNLIPDSDRHIEGTGIIRMNSFNMVFALFMAITLIVVIVMSMLGLVKRLYDLVILFLSLPLVSSLLPLDDGAHFKIWRETVISKVVLAYGTVIAVNVFMLLCPIILSLGGSGFAINILKALLLVGGALAINGGQLLFARLMGTSAEEFRDMTNSARALAGGVMGTVGAMKGGANLLLGHKNAMGHRMGGVLPIAGAAARGAGNLAGNLLGGNAYRGAANYMGSKAAGAANAIRGATGMYKRDAYGQKIVPPNSGTNALMQNNGLIGAALKARTSPSPKMLDGSASTLSDISASSNVSVISGTGSAPSGNSLIKTAPKVSQQKSALDKVKGGVKKK